MAFDDPLTMALLGASAGFLDPRGGMMGGFHGAMQGLKAGNDIKRQDRLDKQAQLKLERQMNAEQMMKDVLAQQQQAGDMHPLSVARAFVNTGNPDLVSQGFGMQKDFKDKVRTTVKGIDENKQPVFHSIMESGETRSTGITPAEKLMQINRGSQIDLANPYTGQAQSSIGVGMAPGESARLAQAERQFGASHGLAQQNAQFNQNKAMLEMNPEFQAQRASMIAGGKEAGKLRGEALSRLPGTVATMAETLNLSDTLKNHPALEMMTGASRFAGKGLAAIGGNQEADFQSKFEQATGKQFLSAIESMRGFGQLTEREGDKMQSSASAMSLATNAQDFKKAQDDYQQALIAGVRKIAKQAGIPEEEAMRMISSERGALKNSVVPSADDGWGELR